MTEDRRLGNDQLGERRELSTSTVMAEVLDLRAQVRALQADQEQRTIAVVESADQITPTMTLEAMQTRDIFIQNVINNFFKEGLHFGVPFPGAKGPDGKPIRMLYKVGAEWFASGFGVRPEYVEIEAVKQRGDTPLVLYRYRCNLVYFKTGQIVGSAEGVCSSDEEKYKYRLSNYKCPSCGQETIMRGRAEWGGGWYCNKNKGGCGAKYERGSVEIENQPKPGRTLNPDLFGLEHTISAMAQKRAFVLAVRGTFGLGAYIQYFEGLDDEVIEEEVPSMPPRVQEFLNQVEENHIQDSDPESPTVDDITWTRDATACNKFIDWAQKTWTENGAEPLEFPHLVNRIIKVLALDGKAKDRAGLRALLETYPGSKDDAANAVRTYNES
jgi:predicted RNA-binding Zn-ribbon protein involved in translation (DUF1610 family)